MFPRQHPFDLPDAHRRTDRYEPKEVAAIANDSPRAVYPAPIIDRCSVGKKKCVSGWTASPPVHRLTTKTPPHSPGVHMRSLRFAVAALLVSTMLWLVPSAEAACTAAPRDDCRRPVVPSSSILRFKQTGKTDPDDIYIWKWRFGSATAVADFGMPQTTDDYSLCIYDQSSRSQPVVENHAAAGAGWIARNDAFLFQIIEVFVYPLGKFAYSSCLYGCCFHNRRFPSMFVMQPKH